MNSIQDFSIKEGKFTEGWWREFLLKSAQMSKATVLRNMLENDDLRVLNESLLNLLHGAARTQKYRLYIDNILQDNSILEKSLPRDLHTLQNWAEFQFPLSKIGLIVNQCEQLSPELAQIFSKYLQPLNEIIGSPLRGYNLTIFLGNYGYTPLGIHQDGRGNNVMHFHLGPAPKIMYNWEESNFNLENLNLPPNDSSLNSAEKFEIYKGDLYYMPWNKYHIGFTGEFSISITLWFNNPTRFSFLNYLVTEWGKNHQNESETILQSKTLRNASFYDDFSSLIDITNDSILGIDEALSEQYLEEILKLESNGQWNSVSLLDEERLIKEHQVNKSVVLEPGFPIRYKLKGNSITLFVRGHKSITVYSDALTSVIDDLNLFYKLELKKIFDSPAIHRKRDAARHLLLQYHHPHRSHLRHPVQY
jgi:hypothetical protein